MDVLFIHPNAAEINYQDLGREYAAIEPPIWAGLLAGHCRQKGYEVAILDPDAERLTDDQILERVHEADPRLLAVVVYGQHPSASTQTMEGAVRIADKIKARYPESRILFVGPHVAALPADVMQRHPSVDFVCQNEGVYTISGLLATDLHDGLNKIKGLGYRRGGGQIFNEPSPIVAQEDLADEMPGVAWDLLPADRYRTALWHALPNDCRRQPFASVYTSLGCPMRCAFCMINIINRQDNLYADGSAVFRYWEPEHMIKEFDRLAGMGIKNIKIADELFVYKTDHFLKLCHMIIDRGYDFNIWCYARVDMTRPEYLAVLKQAGVNFLALGIESADPNVRKDVTKGRFKDLDIKQTVDVIRDHGISVAGNYIFGLPEDDGQSMQRTLDLALELNTEMANFYCAMAYPGSPLYGTAVKEGWPLPDRYAGYAQHSYYTQPLPTKHLSSAEVLAFRDQAWQTYHTHPRFLDLLAEKFGNEAAEQTRRSARVRLRRKILEEASV